MQLVDTHAHLDEEAFDGDRVQVIEHYLSEGVSRVVTIGTTAESSRRAVAIAKEFPSVFAAVGIQPNYVSQAGDADWQAIEELATQPKVVAIGETGLDRYWDYAPIDLQVDFFRRHIELAARLDLPFVVHCRESESDVVAELRSAAESKLLRGVMHSFAGDLAMAQACLELGMHISFAGMVTYKKSQALREVAAQIPAGRILVETDSPYLPPQPMRGKRNEPAFIKMTAAMLAELRGTTLEEFARQTTANATALFRGI